jgi:hypothetical protein
MPKQKFVVTNEPLNLEAELAQKLTLVNTRTLRGKTVYLYQPSLEDLNSFGEIDSNENTDAESILYLIRHNKTPIHAEIIEADDANDIDNLFNNLKIGGKRRNSKKSRKSKKTIKSKKSKKTRKSRKSRK